jgi:stage II sporulation protein GA (sporulation sigma-E factor processing peptidase)
MYGDNMKIYLDIVILVNFLYDILIMMSVSILLKKHVSIYRLLLSSIIGETALITLFIRMNNILLFLLKIVLSIVMVIISFGIKDFFNNIFYFYIITIILGGACYLIDSNNILTNVITILIIGPFILYLYILNIKKYNLSINTIYDVILIDDNNIIKLRGIMDTGNNIKCNITNLPVILVNNKLVFKSNKLFLVPYRTISNKGIINCFKLDKVIINGNIIDCLVGVVENINIGDVLLNNYMREIL